MGSPELVGLQVIGRESLEAVPAIDVRGVSTPIVLDRDHVLIGDHWFPIERETSLAVQSWLAAHADDGRISPKAYVALYQTH